MLTGATWLAVAILIAHLCDLLVQARSHVLADVILVKHGRPTLRNSMVSLVPVLSLVIPGGSLLILGGSMVVPGV